MSVTVLIIYTSFPWNPICIAFVSRSAVPDRFFQIHLLYLMEVWRNTREKKRKPEQWCWHWFLCLFHSPESHPLKIPVFQFYTSFGRRPLHIDSVLKPGSCFILHRNKTVGAISGRRCWSRGCRGPRGAVAMCRAGADLFPCLSPQERPLAHWASGVLSAPVHAWGEPT